MPSYRAALSRPCAAPRKGPGKRSRYRCDVWRWHKNQGFSAFVCGRTGCIYDWFLVGLGVLWCIFAGLFDVLVLCFQFHPILGSEAGMVPSKTNPSCFNATLHHAI